jgi:hypothetical protein
MTDSARWRSPSPTRHLQGIDDQSVRMWSAIDQPTIIREYTSSIAQQCTVPSLVQCSV